METGFAPGHEASDVMTQSETISVRSMRESERDAVRDVTLAAYSEYAGVLPEPF